MGSGFTSSAGIAANKLLAKISSALNKPHQQTIVPFRAVDGLMKDLPLEKLCNFGEMNCTTAGKVAALPHKALDASFGEERATSIARAVKELPKSMLAAKSFNTTSKGSQGDRSKASSAPRPGRDGYTTALLQEAGCMLLRKCCDIYPCTRLALQASDFVPTPLSEDQGAITRFFNGNQPQKAGGTLCTCNEFSSDLLTSALPHQAARLALQTREGKEEAGQSDSPRVGNGEGTQASKAPHQRSITALFKKTAAATAKPIGSKPAAEGSGASGKSAARPAAEAQQPAAELQGKPQALEHGVMDDRSGSAKVHRIIERASPQKPSGTATLRQAADVAGQLPYSSAGLHSGQADEALLDVDVAEQRRIMRDIWVRQHISRGSPRKADKGHAGNVKRKLKQAGEPGLGSNTTCTT
ncbi:g11936 [Coccomyxa viridis]|uniref:G11936 protein n=1 Tax=Coccomyxa viridis TaxID=1274662 RepID=A0ABP1GBU0_9CHLO